MNFEINGGVAIGPVLYHRSSGTTVSEKKRAMVGVAQVSDERPTRTTSESDSTRPASAQIRCVKSNLSGCLSIGGGSLARQSSDIGLELIDVGFVQLSIGPKKQYGATLASFTPEV